MKILLLMISCLGSACWAADWQPVSRENANGTSFYIDLDSVIDEGRFARAWTLESRRIPKSVTLNRKRISYQSYISLKIFDCYKRRSATVQGTFYAQPRGKGDVLHSFSEQPSDGLFSEVTPLSMGEALMEAACEHPPLRKTQV